MSKPALLRGLRSGVLVFIVLAATGCSVRQYAVNRLGDALAQSSGGTFASDDDPDLVKAAAPFSLKLIESLLAESPNHLLLLRPISPTTAARRIRRSWISSSIRSISRRSASRVRPGGAMAH